MPWPLAPMKATSGRLPRGAEWRYEPKWDGHRIIVRTRGDRFDAISSSGQDRTERWPWLANSVRAACATDVILDGEVIALDENGHHSFQLVGRSDRPHSFVVFDILDIDGAALLARRWSERRELLETHVHPAPQLSITPFTDDADAMMVATKQNAFEGVVAKRLDSIYLAGRRTTSWVKVKHRFEQEFVIGGYLNGEGSRSTSFGSILVGYHEHGALRFAGAVGSGFTEIALRALQRRFADLATDECPFDPAPALARGRAVWVRPEVVAQVTFGEWTEAGHLRHPVFLGIRDDKRAADVVRER